MRGTFAHRAALTAPRLWMLARSCVFAALFVFATCMAIATSAQAASAKCVFDSVTPGTRFVEIQTQVGSLCIELFADTVPEHVENFLYYLRSNRSSNVFFHRAIPGKFLQIGGFALGTEDFVPVSERDVSIQNKPCVRDTLDPARPGQKICSSRGNERGTLALQKDPGQPDSGSTDWFINLSDNRSEFDNENGGYTVFGKLVNGSIDVADAIADLPQATNDDLAWMQSEYQSDLFFRIPLREPSLSQTFGCWDRSVQAVALERDQVPRLDALDDPIIGGVGGRRFPFQLSAACGTLIAAPANADALPENSCIHAGGIGVRVTGPLTMHLVFAEKFHVSFTCDQVADSLAGRAAWLREFIPHFRDQLIRVESVYIVKDAMKVEQVPTLPICAILIMLGAVLACVRFQNT